MSNEMTIDQIKVEEFLRRAFELSDQIHQGSIKSVTLTQIQMDFYGFELIPLMQTFLGFLQQLEGPQHPEDRCQVTWHVYADKHKDGYRLKFTQRLEADS